MKKKFYTKLKDGFKEVEGVIYKDYGVYKGENNRYYCIILNGINKGFALCDCSTIKLTKKFIDDICNIARVEEVESEYFNSNIHRNIAKVRNGYWTL